MQALRKKSKDLYGQVQALQQLRQMGAPPPGGTRPAAAAADDLAGTCVIDRSFAHEKDITDVITSDTPSGGLEVHMNALQSQLSTMQEERTQVLSLLESMGVFEAGEEDLSRHDPLPSILQVFVKRCTEAVQKGAGEMQSRAQAAADSAAEAQRLRERIAQLEVEARDRPSAPEGPSARETELEAALQVAQEKQQKDRALARTKIEQLMAERASLQQQLASAREAQEQYGEYP